MRCVMTKIMSGKNVTNNVTGLKKLGVEKQKEIILGYNDEDYYIEEGDYTEEEYREAYPLFNMTGLGEGDMLEGMIDLLDNEND
ncbi:hypothetical protein ACFLY2_02670 [Patescibacteria group bacterium]